VRFAFSVLAAMLVLAAGSGCSDDGDEGSTSATTDGAALTEPEPAATIQSGPRPKPPADQSRWAKQVDAACRPWQARIDGLAPPRTAAELEPWLGELLPLVRTQVSAIKDVNPPAKQDEAKKAALFIQNITKLERSLTRYQAAIRAGDNAKIQRALREANAAGAASRGYALSLDVTECGGYSGG
jgi:hypothetical protein